MQGSHELTKSITNTATCALHRLILVLVLTAYVGLPQTLTGDFQTTHDHLSSCHHVLKGIQTQEI